ESFGPKQAEPLIAYLRSPNPSTVLTLCVLTPLAPSHWLAKSVAPVSVVDLPQLAGRALASWLRSRASSEGYELSDEAAQLLITLVGDDPAALAGEMATAAVGGGAENRRGVVGRRRGGWGWRGGGGWWVSIARGRSASCPERSRRGPRRGRCRCSSGSAGGERGRSAFPPPSRGGCGVSPRPPLRRGSSAA